MNNFNKNRVKIDCSHSMSLCMYATNFKQFGIKTPLWVYWVLNLIHLFCSFQTQCFEFILEILNPKILNNDANFKFYLWGSTYSFFLLLSREHTFPCGWHQKRKQFLFDCIAFSNSVNNVIWNNYQLMISM